jgi:hypothetical protein
MPTVAINEPKTPVTKGSMGVAAATIPNICKMPGPPAPFVPTPLPNIGTSDNCPQGYSTSVKIEGAPVAIQGSSFLSKGDIASMGTGGGILSNNAHGATTFIGPGALDVQIESKNVQLLGDPMLNNGAPTPTGSPPNSATMGGVLQGPALGMALEAGVLLEAQHICDVKCDCQATGGGQACISARLAAEDAATGYNSPIKPEVPFNMNPAGGGPPTPYMSQNDPRRATTRWWIKGSRRPDAVVVCDPTQPFCGENIKAVIEVKLGDDDWGAGQQDAYKEIGGGRDVIEINEETCKCDSDYPDPPPLPVPKDVKVKEKEKQPWISPGLADALAATALVAGVICLGIAAVVSAPVWVPALGVAAAAAGAAVLFSGDSTHVPETA